MVKLKGPGLSQAASGQFADILTFTKTKNGSYVKTKVIPLDPKSGLQIGHRAMVAFLSQYWSILSQAEKDTWKARAQQTQIGSYHAYMATNSQRWGNWLSPLKQDLPPATGTPPSTPANIATGGVGIFYYQAYCGVYLDLWGHAVSLSKNPAGATTKDNTVKVFIGNPTGYASTSITPLEPGLWYVWSRAFSIQGLFGPTSSRRQAVVT